MYRVLLVDNDPQVRAKVAGSRVWEEHRFQVKSQAASAAEALHLFRAQPYDLMVTDIQMPGGDGFSLLEQVVGMEREAMVVLLSDNREFSCIRRGMRLGAFDYLDKPVDAAALSQMLTRAKDRMDRRHRVRLPAALEMEPLLDALQAEPYSGGPVGEAAGQLIRLASGDSAKAASLLEQLLEQMFTALCARYGWLSRFEQFSPAVQAGVPKPLADQFDLHMSSLLQMVRKYGLYYNGGPADQACRYMAAHLEALPAMEQVAEELRLNKDYFGKLFARATKMPFRRFATVLKVEYAKQLMRGGNYTNCELAVELGYGTTDYFVKLFKEHTGITPAQYKKGTAARGGIQSV